MSIKIYIIRADKPIKGKKVSELAIQEFAIQEIAIQELANQFKDYKTSVITPEHAVEIAKDINACINENRTVWLFVYGSSTSYKMRHITEKIDCNEYLKCAFFSAEKKIIDENGNIEEKWIFNYKLCKFVNNGPLSWNFLSKNFHLLSSGQLEIMCLLKNQTDQFIQSREKINQNEEFPICEEQAQLQDLKNQLEEGPEKEESAVYAKELKNKLFKKINQKNKIFIIGLFIFLACVCYVIGFIFVFRPGQYVNWIDITVFFGIALSLTFAAIFACFIKIEKAKEIELVSRNLNNYQNDKAIEQLNFLFEKDIQENPQLIQKNQAMDNENKEILDYKEYFDSKLFITQQSIQQLNK